MPGQKRVAALQSAQRALQGDWPVLKKVAVNQLTVGMFVHGFEENWLKHPFWRSRFLIENPATLREVQESGIKHCLIPSPKHVIVGYDKNGKLTDWVYAKEQTAQSMLKILGYL